MGHRVYLRFFGPVTFDVGNVGPSPLVGKKLQALLGYLAFEPREHSRDELAALLWGDMPEASARHNLRQALSKLRGVLGSDAIAAGERVRLDEATCTSDVAELGDAIRCGDVARVARLYQHELLEGVAVREDSFDDWLRIARASIRGRVCAAIDAHIGENVDGNGAAALEALVRRRLELDPACEEAHRALMKILWKTGRRTEAIRQRGVCAEHLQDALGASPSAATEALLAEIRSADPAPPRRVAPQVPTGEPPSVAVMPFESLGGEADRYFADGMSEDIITALGHFRSLTVIARAASFRMRDERPSVREIGERLRTAYLVQGSVRRAEGRVRVNVQLVDATSERQLWAQRFDGAAADVFALQDEVTSKVASTLAVRVEAARLAEVRRTPTENLDAYDCVLRGKYYHHLSTPPDCDRALVHFHRAVERDGDYALAHAWLACGFGQAMVFRPAERERLLEQAGVAAERGRGLDDNESECHRILAQVRMLQRDMRRAHYHAERSVELNPNDDRCLAGLGEILSFVGVEEEAIERLRRAMRLNPYHPESYWTHLARALFHAGAHGEALEAFGEITTPRLRDWVYAAAAAAAAGDTAATTRASRAVREGSKDFDAALFVASLPYGDEARRQALAAALARAGL